MLNQPEVREDHKNIVEQGFTLVELLIVIVILGILAGIVVFAVGNLTDDAKGNACKTDKATFTSAFQAYKAHNKGTSPPYSAGTEAADIKKDLTETNAATGAPYMQSWPDSADMAHSGAAAGTPDSGKFTFKAQDGSTADCTP